MTTNWRIYLTLIAMLILLLTWTAYGQKAVTFKAQAFTPASTIILKTAPDGDLVCAEPNAGILACRTVQEFRAWVRERSALK